LLTTDGGKYLSVIVQNQEQPSGAWRDRTMCPMHRPPSRTV